MVKIESEGAMPGHNSNMLRKSRIPTLCPSPQGGGRRAPLSAPLFLAKTQRPPQSPPSSTRTTTVIPGLISAHSHVNDLKDLGVFARYGVTTVQSLGGPREVEFRDATRAEQQSPGFTRSRLFIAGPIPTSKTAEEGRAAVDALAAGHTDFVKFRLDDNLGSADVRLTPEGYDDVRHVVLDLSATDLASPAALLAFQKIAPPGTPFVAFGAHVDTSALAAARAPGSGRFPL